MRKTKGMVSSKIEITKPSKDKGKEKGLGLIQYRLSISDMSKKIKVFAIKLSPNLLSVKMALMDTVREVEKMMKERRNA